MADAEQTHRPKPRETKQDHVSSRNSRGERASHVEDDGGEGAYNCKHHRYADVVHPSAEDPRNHPCHRPALSPHSAAMPAPG
eukprot:758442-Hanusia_phi.AAC.2